MKLLSEITKDSLPPKSEGKIVHMIAVLGGWKTLNDPSLSTDLECLICSSTAHYTPIIKPGIDNRRVWICANGDCASNNTKNHVKATITPTPSVRAVLWPEFCEINGIGDKHHDVKFDDIKQSEAKISYMLKFANAPHDIIIMQGGPGTGKTYSAMAICEFFTRKCKFCIFSTQKQMSSNWLIASEDKMNNYVKSVTNTPLLVVDDFATGEPNPKFLEFFMEVINTRMQWKNRGTIITTNLNNEKLSDFCGQALSDRIATGQKLEFKGHTRREKTIL